MERAGNLKHPVWPILLNTIDSTKVNMYYDSIQGVRKMMLPGKTIPINADTSISVTAPTKGRNKLVALMVDAVAPCAECDYEYGVQVKMIRRQPGVNNDDAVPVFHHIYSKILKLDSFSGGYLNGSDQMKLCTEVVRQMNADTELMKYATAGIIYRVLQADNDALYIKKGDTTTTITEAEPATMQEDIFGASLETIIVPTGADDVIGSASAYDYYLLVPYGEELVKIGAAGGVVGTDIYPDGLYLETINQEYEPIVHYDQEHYNKLNLSYAYISENDAALNHRVAVGTDYDDVTGATPAAVGAELEAAIATYSIDKDTGFYVTAAASEATLMGAIDENITIIPLRDADAVTTKIAGMNIQWPGLSADDVFRKFANMNNLGEFAMLQRNDVPLDVEFVKVSIRYQGHMQSSFHGASQGGFAEQRVDLYMPKSVFIGGIYATQAIPDASDSAQLTTGTTNSFAALLEACVTDLKAVGEGDFVSLFDDWTA